MLCTVFSLKNIYDYEYSLLNGYTKSKWCPIVVSRKIESTKMIFPNAEMCGLKLSYFVIETNYSACYNNYTHRWRNLDEKCH